MQSIRSLLTAVAVLSAFSSFGATTPPPYSRAPRITGSTWRSRRRRARSCNVELPLPTFTATAEMAGIPRVMGGYHIQADNIEGLALGRKVTQFEWPRIKAYFDGTAPAPKE